MMFRLVCENVLAQTFMLSFAYKDKIVLKVISDNTLGQLLVT